MGPTEPAATGTDGLRVAVVHEWIDHPGGAENVVREMLATFPQADLWSLWSLSPGSEGMPVPAHTSWLARTPVAGNKALALPLMPVAWRTLPPREYDAVITSSYAFAHAARFRRDQAVRLHYVHTPARYWWTPSIDGRGGHRAASMARWGLRGLDRVLARGHEHVAANSEETRGRIRRFWGLEAVVIHPPVDTDFFVPGPPASALPFEEFVLGVGRWIPYKRLDLVIEAGDRAGLPVVIAGSGPLERELRQHAALARVPVRFEVRPSRERLRDLYRGAAATVFPAHEDFGIVPVESMACGTPVVGPRVGGLVETVADGTSGVLVDEQSAEHLAKGLAALPDAPVERLRRGTLAFSASHFRERLSGWVTAAVRGG